MSNAKLRDFQNEMSTILDQQNVLLSRELVSAEDKAEYEKAEARYSEIEKLAKAMIDSEKRTAEMAVMFGGSKGSDVSGSGNPDLNARQLDACASYFREGGKLTAEQREVLSRATGPMSKASNADGGYLVATAIYPLLYQSLKAFGGIYGNARIIITETAAPLQFDKTDNTSRKGRIIGENAAMAVIEKVQFDKITLTGHKFTSDAIVVSHELLRDSQFDIIPFIVSLAGEIVGRGFSDKFITGTGTNEPTSIVTSAATGVTAAASAITYDNLVDLYHSVNSAYRANASWALNDDTIKIVRKLKDSTGQPIWQMGDITKGTPNTLLGSGIVAVDDMATVGTGASSVLFGDISKYYVREVNDTRFIRNDYINQLSDQVVFALFKTIDAALIDSNAVKKLVHA